MGPGLFIGGDLAFVLLLFDASVAAIVGLPLWVCLADLSLTPGVVMAAVVFATDLPLRVVAAVAVSPLPACHRCQLAVASYSEAACFFLGRTSTASTITMAEAIASAVPSATCRAGMPTSMPVQ